MRFSLAQLAQTYLSQVEAAFGGAMPGTTLRKALTGGGLEFAGGSGNIAFISTLSSEHTGVTTETQIGSLVIPANILFLPGHHLEICSAFLNTGTGNKTYSIRLGSLGGTRLHNVTSSSVYYSYLRRFIYQSSTVTWTNAQGTQFPDAMSASSNAVTHNINWTNSVTLVLSTTLATAGDTSTLQYCIARVFR